MKLLITGCAGFINNHISVEFLEAGHKVFVTDNLCIGHKAVLEWVRDITNCELKFMSADILDKNV